MTTDKPAGAQFEQWASLIGTIAAPITVLGALLFYFGYVSSASEYAYFGINVDTIGLSTQSYIMRSPQTLLVPLLVLTLASAGFLVLNAAVRRRITADVTQVPDVADASAIQAQLAGLWIGDATAHRYRRRDNRLYVTHPDFPAPSAGAAEMGHHERQQVRL